MTRSIQSTNRKPRLAARNWTTTDLSEKELADPQRRASDPQTTQFGAGWGLSVPGSRTMLAA
jgi:hypothetical protein